MAHRVSLPSSTSGRSGWLQTYHIEITLKDLLSNNTGGRKQKPPHGWCWPEGWAAPVSGFPPKPQVIPQTGRWLQSKVLQTRKTKIPGFPEMSLGRKKHVGKRAAVPWPWRGHPTGFFPRRDAPGRSDF